MGAGAADWGCQELEANEPPSQPTQTQWKPEPAVGSRGTRKWVFRDTGTNPREAEVTNLGNLKSYFKCPK